MLPEDLANQSVLLKEQQLVKEQERVRGALMHHYCLINFASIQLREYELRAKHEIGLMKQQLLAKEEALRSVASNSSHAFGLICVSGQES